MLDQTSSVTVLKSLAVLHLLSSVQWVAGYLRTLSFGELVRLHGILA